MSDVVRVIREKNAKVLVVDTLSRCAPGLEENEASKVAAALERLFMIRDALGIAVLVLHHTGHQGLRARGSSVLEDNADASWVIRLNGDGASEDRGPEIPRTLLHRKSKDGELQADKPMTLKPDAGSAYLSFDAFDTPTRAKDKRNTERAGELAEMLTDIRTQALSKELTARSLAREMGWNWDRKVTREATNLYLNE
jgi:RecA-family ATPase